MATANGRETYKSEEFMTRRRYPFYLIYGGLERENEVAGKQEVAREMKAGLNPGRKWRRVRIKGGAARRGSPERGTVGGDA